MKPYRIQRKRTRGWRMPEGAIYVGRPTKWGNPMHVGMYRNYSRFDAVSDFKKWINGELTLNGTAWGNGYGTPLREAARRELRGKNLVCWCSLGEVCHADVLLEVANR